MADREGAGTSPPIYPASASEDPSDGESSVGSPTPGESDSQRSLDRGACPAPGSGPIVLDTANNYTASIELFAPAVVVKPGVDLLFDWGGLRHDIRGRELDPKADIHTLTLMLWRLTDDELSEAFNTASLAQDDTVAVASQPQDGRVTSQSFLALTSAVPPLDPDSWLDLLDPASYPPDEHVYTLSAVTGTEMLKGTRMVQAFRLDPEADRTTVAITDDSTELSYEVDIRSARPTSIPGGVARLEFDWLDMETTALGLSPPPTSEVVVAKFALDVAGLEEHYLLLDQYAEESYRSSEPAESRISLNSLSLDDGTHFAGIDAEGTWLIALLCSDCRSPAPWYLSVLEPCSPP